MTRNIAGGLVASLVAVLANAASAQADSVDCGDHCDTWTDAGVGHDEDAGGGEPDWESYAIDVECRAINDFGYVATVTETLHVTSRNQRVFAVSGTLEVNTKFFGEPDNVRHVQVQGTADDLGQYVALDVLSGADDLQSLFLALQSGTSNIGSKDGIAYQMECTQSRATLPDIADLALLKTLRFTALPDGQLRTQIDVANLGNLPIVGPDVQVRVAGIDVKGALYDLYPDASPNTLESGMWGYIEVVLPAGTLARCSTYSAVLDLEHRVQSGPFDPFANDSGQLASPCLRWTTPITDDALGVPANTLIAGKTLEQIVSSQVSARAEATDVCSRCHSANSGRLYIPPAGVISPSLVIGGSSWSTLGGWVDVFQSKAIKPDYLKQAFQRWRDDGAF